MHAVTWLFVPGDRPERFAKAAASGADEVILDLEDAVAEPAKETARRAVAEWLGSAQAWVRINPAGASWHHADLDALAGRPGLRGVVVPKAEDGDTLAGIAATLGCPVLALIESAAGVGGARGIAAGGAVSRLALGAIDLALDLGALETREALLSARSELVLASRLAGLPAPIDGVTRAVTDLDTVAADVAYARSLGFGGKLCIHPAQVPAVAEGFAPQAADIAWAREVLEAEGRGAAQVAGALVDAPVLERARQVLARAAASDRAPHRDPDPDERS
ncbi:MULTISPECIES: HpcH/HpaI aldolase/citrate lyase family protein [unclassified Nocardioides]|uniref:HpcH/HpaI aldolase/citrate lyase family protein n=1 Tax=unclassified Nocardioides TaxID=2615069 RepID=UPI0009F14413|nr:MULTISPECIES: CoA ester lyase [unclassified Nocardioides]GAW48957.1 HpcH/HpaI aldolase [Nocardioides sp. PD653-B2]GAW55172.1 HpcH/HpaI aldolase [Nocardioides sp. PD653]